MENNDPERNDASEKSKDFSGRKETPRKSQKSQVKSAVAGNGNKFLSVRPPPGFRELPPPAFDTLPPPPGFEKIASPAFNKLPSPPGFEDVPPYRDPPSYEELYLNKKLKLKHCNESNGLNILKNTSKNNESLNLNLVDFESPEVKFWRHSLLPLLSCDRCKQLFNAERQPHIIISGSTACTECTSLIYDISILKVKQTHPLNPGFISAIQNLLFSFKIFHSANPFYSELNRGIYKDGSIQKLNKVQLELKQKFLRHTDCLDQINILISDNKVTLNRLNFAMASAELFKGVVFNSAPLYIELYSLLDTLDCLFTFTRCLDVSVEDYGEEDEWLLWSKMTETPKSIVLNSALLKDVFHLNSDLYLFQDVEGKRIYSRVSGTKNTLYLDAFTPRYPLVSSLTSGKFARFDSRSLKDIGNFYFEIEVSGGSPDYRPSPCRYQVALLHKSISWHSSYLFLGYKNCGFLGAEIEVTEERIIFSHYLRNGLPESGNGERTGIGSKAFTFRPIRYGMVVSESPKELSKLSIFKYDNFTKSVCFIIGSLNPAGMGSLRKIPLGKHKISACGIGIFINGEKSR